VTVRGQHAHVFMWYRYSQGKATALVVDIGHQNTSVTALWEGMVIRKSKCLTPLSLLAFYMMI